MRVRQACVVFQSSPAPKSGCNPHFFVDFYILNEFQSSPAPKSGCNAGCIKISNYCLQVSILTRSEERVQLPAFSNQSPATGCFNPHPLRRAGATPGFHWAILPVSSFNPHPLRRAGATCILPAFPRACNLFQSSPAPKSGCNRKSHEIAHKTYTFQSSPAPKSGCN